MSLIIKGMEMLQAGDMIICGQIDGKLQCTIVTRGKPTKWCEASEVSEPYGRLIDADALENQVAQWRACCKFQDAQILCTVIDMIQKAPTIIKTEVSE